MTIAEFDSFRWQQGQEVKADCYGIKYAFILASVDFDRRKVSRSDMEEFDIDQIAQITEPDSDISYFREAK